MAGFGHQIGHECHGPGVTDPKKLIFGEGSSLSLEAPACVLERGLWLETLSTDSWWWDHYKFTRRLEFSNASEREMRNVLCPRYNTCLSRAVKKKVTFYCNQCRFRELKESIPFCEVENSILLLWRIFKPDLYCEYLKEKQKRPWL